jgi:hypothetical protein
VMWCDDKQGPSDVCYVRADLFDAEHAQRVTLQRHAADRAQRAADLAAERDALRARLEGIEGQDEWRDVVGFTGLYAVSSNGKIKSLSCGKILSTPPMGIGYEKATLYKEGKRTQTSVHRVVAEAFIGKIDGLEVNHKDGNKKNNHVDNLEIVTRSENEKHSRSVLGNLCKPVVAINTETLQCKYFQSIMEASRNGFCDTGIYDVLNDVKKTHHGHLFVYVNKSDYARPIPARAAPDPAALLKSLGPKPWETSPEAHAQARLICDFADALAAAPEAAR